MNKKPIIFVLFSENSLAHTVCEKMGYSQGEYEVHEFPDEESLIRIKTSVEGKPVIIFANLVRPNKKLLPLIFAVETLREFGADKIGLIAPYLPYMRQDKSFHYGEGVTSRYFARLVSIYFDWFVTIDPHLHRWHSLGDIFTIPTKTLHAHHNIADWIKENVKNPILIGPDRESVQWVSEVAKICNAPYLVVKKVREEDFSVTATIPQLESYLDYTPVVIDDIISTGITAIETIRHIQSYEIDSIILLAIHAVFAKNAYQMLLDAGITNIVTCNTIAHPTNQIDLSELVMKQVFNA